METVLRYFSHDVNSRGHWKFKALRKEFGFEGEGRFWVLNCMIAEEKDCRLNLSRKGKKIAIADELNMDLETFSAFLEFLVDKDLGLLKKDEAGYYTDRVDEIFESVMKNRKRQKKHYEKKKGIKPELFDSRDKAREFYRDQLVLSEGQEYHSKYNHFAQYLFNHKGHENVINAPGLHIITIEKQITFKDYIKLFDVCKARNTTPIVLLDSWLNNKAYSKGKVSVYATLRSWANKETVKQTNL